MTEDNLCVTLVCHFRKGVSTRSHLPAKCGVLNVRWCDPMLLNKMRQMDPHLLFPNKNSSFLPAGLEKEKFSPLSSRENGSQAGRVVPLDNSWAISHSSKLPFACALQVTASPEAGSRIEFWETCAVDFPHQVSPMRQQSAQLLQF